MDQAADTALPKIDYAPNAAARPRSAILTHRRFASADLGLRAESTFTIDAGASVVCIGSCFADRIRSLLIAMDIAATGTTLRYTPMSIENTIRWSLEGGWSQDHLFELSDGRWYDPHSRERLHEGYASQNAAEQEIREVLDRTGAALRTADVLVLTFGLAEGWVSSETGMWLNQMPPRSMIEDFDQRFSCRLASHAECVRSIESTLEMVRRENPSLRVLCTVSPLPLALSFARDDVLVGTCVAKSRLRSALDEVIEASPHPVDYFPSYEMVTLQRENVYTRTDARGRPDPRHLPHEFFLEVIAPEFARAYLPWVHEADLPESLPRIDGAR